MFKKALTFTNHAAAVAASEGLDLALLLSPAPPHPPPPPIDATFRPCFDSGFTYLPECTCHATCASCGFGSSPTSDSDCITCASAALELPSTRAPKTRRCIPPAPSLTWLAKLSIHATLLRCIVCPNAVLSPLLLHLILVVHNFTIISHVSHPRSCVSGVVPTVTNGLSATDGSAFTGFCSPPTDAAATALTFLCYSACSFESAPVSEVELDPIRVLPPPASATCSHPSLPLCSGLPAIASAPCLVRQHMLLAGGRRVRRRRRRLPDRLVYPRHRLRCAS